MATKDGMGNLEVAATSTQQATKAALINWHIHLNATLIPIEVGEWSRTTRTQVEPSA